VCSGRDVRGGGGEGGVSVQVRAGGYEAGEGTHHSRMACCRRSRPGLSAAKWARVGMRSAHDSTKSMGESKYLEG